MTVDSTTSESNIFKEILIMKKLLVAVLMTFAFVSSANVAVADISFPTCYPCPEANSSVR
jgi:hypothetical protein